LRTASPSVSRRHKQETLSWPRAEDKEGRSGPTFGEIFQVNCIQNGILAITVAEGILHDLWRQLRAAPRAEMNIDLPERSIDHLDAPNGVFRFERIIPRPFRSIFRSYGQAEHLSRRSGSRRPAMRDPFTATAPAAYTGSFAAALTVAAILGLTAGAKTARAWEQQVTDAEMSSKLSYRAVQRDIDPDGH